MAFRSIPFLVKTALLLISIKIVCAADGSNNNSILSVPLVPLLKYLRNSTFPEEYTNMWGAQNQNVSPDGSIVTLKLDKTSGSGFRSKEAYMYGFFNAAVKLQVGYTAGVITSFYTSNGGVYDGSHDEIDIEFLGTIPGEQYKLQTNIYGNGTGDGPHIIGREQQFHLWFDPTSDFHNYSILWTPHQILFLVDGIPIRTFPKVKSLGVVYPSRPMSIYASIWNGAWATPGHPVDYSYAPFLGSYTNFITIGCEEKDEYCSGVLLDECLVSPRLNAQQMAALQYVRKHYMVYDYCQDFKRYPNGTMPECSAQPLPSVEVKDNSVS